jgi:hypothetical protein
MREGVRGWDRGVRPLPSPCPCPCPGTIFGIGGYASETETETETETEAGVGQDSFPSIQDPLESCTIRPARGRGPDAHLDGDQPCAELSVDSS